MGVVNSSTELDFCHFFVDASFEVKFEEISDLRYIGSGAQGSVYYGKLRGEEVAVKKLRHAKDANIKHLRKLNHPNVITFKYVNSFFTNCPN